MTCTGSAPSGTAEASKVRLAASQGNQAGQSGRAIGQGNQAGQSGSATKQAMARRSSS